LRKDSYSDFLKIMIPIWVIGIVGSLMRHLWISLFISVVFLFFLLPKKNKKVLKNIFFHYAFFAAVLFVLVAYVSFLFPQASISKVFNGALGVAGQRFVSTAQVSSDESLNWRRSVWQATWKDFQHSLVFGLGYGKKISVEIGLKYKDFVEVRNIHNSLLTIFIQMGLWSVALVAAMLWFLFKSVYFALRKSEKELGDTSFLRLAFLALFVNYLAAFLFQTYLETNLLGIFFWIILGGLSVLGNNEIEETK
jgi:O-antigen ligase